jgi:heptosyltransferase-2
MGDTIVAVPMLRAARQVFPEATITLVTGMAAATALEHCPFVDTFLRYNPRDPHYNSQELFKALTQCATSPDVCLVADRSFRSAYLALRIGGKVRAGFASEGRGFLLTHPVTYRASAPEIECCLDILRAVVPEGQDTPAYDPTPQLFITGEERNRGSEILVAQGATPGTCVGIQPGANDGKAWLPKRYAEVAKELISCGKTVVLLGSGKGEEQVAEQVRQAIGELPTINLTSKTTLRETMGVLTQLSLFIGNDTGVNHLAASLGVPTIALFGQTSAIKWGHQSEQNRVLTAPDGDMTRLEREAVLRVAQELLEKKIVQPSPAAGVYV